MLWNSFWTGDGDGAVSVIWKVQWDFSRALQSWCASCGSAQTSTGTSSCRLVPLSVLGLVLVFAFSFLSSGGARDQRPRESLRGAGALQPLEKAGRRGREEEEGGCERRRAPSLIRLEEEKTFVLLVVFVVVFVVVGSRTLGHRPRRLSKRTTTTTRSR